MTTFVSLFRGINVGGHQVVRMDALKELHTALGLKDVVTYIQSGNVVFTGDSADTAQLARRIEEAFAEKFGFQASVVVRTADEISAIMASNPFQHDPAKESKWVAILCMAQRPGETAQEDLRKAYAGPEEFYVIGQELYVYYPNGMGRSKLTHSLLEKTLKTPVTGRNWNTFLQLQKMIERQ